MPRSLRQRRWSAFCQLDRITSRRRNLLTKWFRSAVIANKTEDGSYYGMTMAETVEVDRTINDIRQFCATEEGENNGQEQRRTASIQGTVER